VKAKLLNLEEALQMYDLIGEYLPTEPVRGIDAINDIVNRMGMEKYFMCLQILTGETRDTIICSDKNDRLSALLIGFQDNKLFELSRLKQDGLYG
jgi:hypothetical protein